MNTLEDLRASLTQRADQLHDDELYARPAAVHGRIRAVRRRRATGVTVAAVALLVAGVAGVGVLRQPDNGPQPAVAGIDVPREVTISSYPYEFAEAQSISEGELVKLPKADDDQAVSLVANGLGKGSATLYVDDQAVARAFGSEIALPVPVGDFGATLRLKFDGAAADARAGLAVYSQTGELPPGVSSADNSAVFPDRVGANALVTAAFAEPGASDVTVSFDGRPSDVSFASYCSATSGQRVHLNVTLDGDGVVSGRCQDQGSNAAGSTYTLDPTSNGADQPGSHVMRAYLTRGPKGPEVDVDDAVLGVGVYRGTTQRRDVLGMSVDEITDYGGRTWQLERVVPDSDGHDVTVSTADGDRLIGLVASGETVWASWDGRLDSGETARLSSSPGVGPASSIGGLLLKGDSYQARIRSEGGSAFEGSLLIYRPV